MATSPNVRNLEQSGALLLLVWEQGECRDMQVGTDTYDPFFPEGNRSTRDARRICHGCGVWEQCLQYALDTGQPEGIWGGYSPAERRQMVREEAV